MRILVQWAQQNPQDWVTIDSADWHTLPNRGDPPHGRGAQNPGNELGWVNRLCVQGVHFPHDHYAVRDLPDGAIEVSTWNDDPEDYPPGDFYAAVWTFQPLFQDPRIGGGWNTRQSRVIYAADDIRNRLEVLGPTENTVIRPWQEFVHPLTIVRHGVWLPDELYAEHHAKLSQVRWRDWTPP